MTLSISIEKRIGSVLLATYTALFAATWLFGGIWLAFAWIMSALLGMYLSMRLTTLCKISPWDNFWRPVVGVTWFWASAALIILATPELLLHVTWQQLGLACVCLAPLIGSWWLRAQEKRRAAHSFFWIHLLAILGATQIPSRIWGL